MVLANLLLRGCAALRVGHFWRPEMVLVEDDEIVRTFSLRALSR
jgi:hypothetical protein